MFLLFYTINSLIYIYIHNIQNDDSSEYEYSEENSEMEEEKEDSIDDEKDLIDEFLNENDNTFETHSDEY